MFTTNLFGQSYSGRDSDLKNIQDIFNTANDLEDPDGLSVLLIAAAIIGEEILYEKIRDAFLGSLHLECDDNNHVDIANVLQVIEKKAKANEENSIYKQTYFIGWLLIAAAAQKDKLPIIKILANTCQKFLTKSEIRLPVQDKAFAVWVIVTSPLSKSIFLPLARYKSSSAKSISP